MNQRHASIVSVLALLFGLAAFANSLIPLTPVAQSAAAQQEPAPPAGEQAVDAPSAGAIEQLDAATAAAAQTASVPPFLSYQGVLRDAENKPINGEVKVTFRIYRNVTDPVDKAMWPTRPLTPTVVSARNGVFSVLLGDMEPLPSSVFRSGNRYLGITVEGYEEMKPRQRFSMVPYAATASSATSLRTPNGALLAPVYTDNAGTLEVKSDGQGRIRLLNGNNSWAQISRDPNRLTMWSPDGIDFAVGGGGQSVMWVPGDGNIRIGNPAVNPASNIQIQSKFIRLSDPQNPGKALWLRTDGGAVDLESENSNLWINGANGAALLLNNRGDAGDVVIGHPGRWTYFDSAGIRIRGQPPVKVLHWFNVPDNTPMDTEMSINEWTCVFTGWASNLDVEETDRGTWRQDTYHGPNGNWWFYFEIRSNGPERNTDLYITCFHNSITSFEDRNR